MVHPVAVIVGLGAAGLYALSILFRKKKVFVSYYYDDDSNYKNMLKAWSKNKKFDLEFDDVSADISIDSINKASIKRALSRKIKNSDVVLVLVGKKSHKREWISWEISKAKELKRPIVAVKIKKSYSAPKELLSSGVSWAMSFNYKSILKAINDV